MDASTRRVLLVAAGGSMWLTSALAGAGVGVLPPTTASGPVPTFVSARPGGDTTARELRDRPLNQAARNLANADRGRFGAGAEVFRSVFAEGTPGSGSLGGLGPQFIDRACVACHVDGASPAVHGQPGDPGPGLVVRLSVPGAGSGGAPAPEPTYGLEVQTGAVPGLAPEGRVRVRWQPVKRRVSADEEVELRRPEVVVDDLRSAPLAPDTVVSARVAPPLPGLGLLAAVPDRVLEQMADPADRNGDGISGRVNHVSEGRPGQVEVGRFGWKAAQPSVRSQVAAALALDMGVGSDAHPNTCDGSGCARPDPPVIELARRRFDDLTLYAEAIAVPEAPALVAPDPVIAEGARTFADIGCASCHVPTLRTGSSGPVGTRNQTIHPYADLLLHDLGDGLADGRREFAAGGSEWRTPPLWGIHVRAEVGFALFLHDGRARSVQEAIWWHGGEASRVVDRFAALPKGVRKALIRFVESL